VLYAEKDMVQLCKRVTDVRFDLDDYARDNFFRADSLK